MARTKANQYPNMTFGEASAIAARLEEEVPGVKANLDTSPEYALRVFHRDDQKVRLPSGFGGLPITEVRSVEAALCERYPPPEQVPREHYRCETASVDMGKGYWSHLDVTVFDTNDDRRVASYRRNYSAMYRTFEPFRQLASDGTWREYALIAPEYTRTSVLCLKTGEIVAREPWPIDDDGEEHPGWGFCPVDFYVPDWWDVQDGSITPLSKYWDEHMQRPDGTFGLVAGCVWGDDSSWKIQYLDLSQINDGLIVRDDRFGYIRMGGPTLQESATYWQDSDSFTFSLGIDFSRSGELDKFCLEGLTNGQG